MIPVYPFIKNGKIFFLTTCNTYSKKHRHKLEINVPLNLAVNQPYDFASSSLFSLDRAFPAA